jgi:Fur family peroxide stress response transcriptional regulator
MSQATVYKTLALLKDMGQVLEIDLHDDSHYDGNRPQPHPHLICVKCSRIVDGDVTFERGSIKKLEKRSGYSILRSQISLYGLCSDCQEKG